MRGAVVGEAQMDHDGRRAHGFGAAHRPIAAAFRVAAFGAATIAAWRPFAFRAAAAMVAATAAAHVHSAAAVMAAARTSATALTTGSEARHRPDEHVGGNGPVEKS